MAVWSAPHHVYTPSQSDIWTMIRKPQYRVFTNKTEHLTTLFGQQLIQDSGGNESHMPQTITNV